MDNLEYISQSVKDLEYNFYKSINLKYNFKILRNKIVYWHDFILEYSIIGASHFVKIDIQKNKQFTELLACLSAKDLQKDLLKNEKIIKHNEFNYFKKFNNYFKYSFSSLLIEDKLSTYEAFKEKYYLKGEEYIDFIFPDNHGLAITSIAIIEKMNKLSWISFHTYPEENKIVKTHSIIERREENERK
ncbi:DUF2617 family protein [Natronospora cellulosivora (SeqCode)]